MADEQKVVMEPAEYMEYLRSQAKGDSTPVAQLTMYDMNKDLVRGLKKMNNMAVNQALDKVKNWFINIICEQTECKHFALLNHEKHYFTIFEGTDAHSEDSFVAAVKDILMNYYGDCDIRAIDVQDENSVEIWGMWDGEPTVAYLFPYEQGVVYY